MESKLLLEVNQQKTSICRPVNFVLFGHTFTPTYKTGVKGFYRLSVARKSWEGLKRKVKALTRKTDPMPLDERLKRLNWLMRGWVNYFKGATGYEKYGQLDGPFDYAQGTG